MSSVYPTNDTFRDFHLFQQGNRNAKATRVSAADWPIVSLYVIAIVGLGLSSYLGWAGLTSSKVAGCGAGQVFDCSHVLTSKWSTVVGIPVGLPAAGLYLTVLGTLATLTIAKTGQTKQFAKLVLYVCAFAAAMAAIWFISLQLFVVEHLCSYCLAAHTCGLLLAGMVMWKYPISRSKTFAVAATALASVSVLATVQWNAEASKTYEVQTFAPIALSPENFESEGELFIAPGFSKPDDNVFAAPIESTQVEPNNGDGQASILQTEYISLGLAQLFNPTALVTAPGQENQNEQPQADSKSDEPRFISINGGQSKLNVAHWPLCGKRSAECIFVEMFDYTCPHCRENHRTIKQVSTQLGEDKPAIIALAVPMNRNCNSGVTHADPKHAEACELAKLAISVWRVAPSKFGEFHDWMFTGDSAPTYLTARSHAESLVDKKQLTDELNKGVANNYVAAQVKLYNQTGAGAIPRMMFPTTTVSGKVGSPESLLQIIRQQAGR